MVYLREKRDPLSHLSRMCASQSLLCCRYCTGVWWLVLPKVLCWLMSGCLERVDGVGRIWSLVRRSHGSTIPASTVQINPGSFPSIPSATQALGDVFYTCPLRLHRVRPHPSALFKFPHASPSVRPRFTTSTAHLELGVHPTPVLLASPLVRTTT